MIRVLILIYLGATSFYLFGQVGQSDRRQITNGSNIGFFKGDHLPDSFLKLSGKNFNYKDINGTPYINNNQKLKYDIPIGKLYTSKKELINILFMRYNAYSDNIELSTIDDSIDYYLLKKKPNSWYAVLGTNQYHAYNYIANRQSTIGFFVIVSENDTNQYTLLKKEKIVFKQAEKEKSSFLTDTPPHFRKVKDEYFVKINETVSKIPTKKKYFFKLFKLKQNELKSFIKNKNLKITKENDLLEIITYYNSLFQQ